jgi:hypothetical protein
MTRLNKRQIPKIEITDIDGLVPKLDAITEYLKKPTSPKQYTINAAKGDTEIILPAAVDTLRIVRVYLNGILQTPKDCFQIVAISGFKKIVFFDPLPDFFKVTIIYYGELIAGEENIESIGYSSIGGEEIFVTQEDDIYQAMGV